MAPSKLQKRRNNLIIQMMAYAAAEAAAEATTDVTLTLTWTSGTGTLTPTFTLSGAIVEGDVITLSIYSDAGLTTLVDSDANTVDAAEVLAGVIDFPGIGALSAGTYWAVATLAATGRTGTSNTETKTLISFDPASLFSGGEKGFWLDASDLTKMFQLSGGTGAVAADADPVGYYLDKSGNGHVFTQTTAGQRPLYKTDGTKHWLLFDGVDDLLQQSGNAVMQNIAALTMVVAVDYGLGSGTQIFVSGTDSGGVRRGTLSCNSNEQLNLWGERLDAAGASVLTGATDRSGTPRIILGEIDFTNADGFLYVGQTLETSSTTFLPNSGNTSNTNGDRLSIGGEYGVESTNGKIYQVLVIARLLTGTEKTNLGGYMATKSGATY
jgi:hypothetical protein